MQFSILTMATLITAVLAGPIVKRQIDPSKPSMTDKEGNVVEFNTAEVYQANKDAGI
ncbi:hypothetical protein B0T10DRAFT_19717 [Thelonectria olida]|uniref:Uncharacterized protein n=1 Tax=Thelonectria olida TaxID=1576542 RepID=A0A9P8WM03_9HYPO|nr:hypothetical protein B0T10DRAFT_19717 [Thelonectria olida]